MGRASRLKQSRREQRSSVPFLYRVTFVPGAEQPDAMIELSEVIAQADVSTDEKMRVIAQSLINVGQHLMEEHQHGDEEAVPVVGDDPLST